ncbi:MAG: FHA domain-containing protein [Microthrixaceae bacterium]
MSEQLLTILKFCLLALLYLFFLRVLRAVWTEINPPKVAAETPTPSARSGRAPKGERAKSDKQKKAPKPVASNKGSRRPSGVPSRLMIIEPVAQAGGHYVLGPETTVGRSPGCSIVLDEQYVSQVHARFFVRGDTLFVEDLGSTNGTWVNGSRAVGQMPVRVGNHVQIGNLIMEAQ